MAVANQENHLVSDVSEKITNAFSGPPTVAAEESSAVLQSLSNQRTMFLVLLLRAKILDNPLSLLCSKTDLARKGTKTITGVYHLGHNTRQDRGVHRHQLQRHQLLIPARR
jgi:hypothetical protein